MHWLMHGIFDVFLHTVSCFCHVFSVFGYLYRLPGMLLYKQEIKSAKSFEAMILNIVLRLQISERGEFKVYETLQKQNCIIGNCGSECGGTLLLLKAGNGRQKRNRLIELSGKYRRNTYILDGSPVKHLNHLYQFR